MNVDETVLVLRENGVEFDGKFAQMGLTGYPSDGCQILAEECLALVGKYCRAGVNGGFNKSMRDAIKELTRLCVQLSEKKAEKKLAKYEAARDKIAEEVKLTTKGENFMSIKAVVYKYLDTSEKACEVIKKLGTAPDRDDILVQSAEKLREIRAVLEEALDDSSQDAAALAEQLIGCLVRWRNDVSSSMYSKRSVGYIEDALGYARKWKELRASVKQGVFSRDKSAKKIPEYVPDAIDRIAESDRIKERIIIFRRNLKKFDDDLELRYGVTGDREALRENTERIEELKAEKSRIADAVRNGETDKVDAMYRCRDQIDPEIADLEEENKRLSAQIAEKEQMRRAFRKQDRFLNGINDFILGYEQHPAVLYTLGAAIDFNKMNNVMIGLANADELEHIVDLKLVERNMTDRTRSQLKQFIHTVDDALHEYDEEHRTHTTGETVRDDREQRRAEQERRDREADAYFAQLDGGTDGSGAETEGDLLSPRRVTLSDDDK